MLSVILDYATLCAIPDAGDQEAWQPLPGSLEAIARLHRADWRVLVIGPLSAHGTPDIARVTRLHNRLSQAAANAGGQIDAVFFCPHGPGRGCDCCPPAPGLLEEIARRQQQRLSTLICILADTGPVLEAARTVGADCLTLGPHGRFRSLDAAVQSLLDATPSA